jgi:hypothetical protein
MAVWCRTNASGAQKKLQQAGLDTQATTQAGTADCDMHTLEDPIEDSDEENETRTGRTQNAVRAVDDDDDMDFVEEEPAPASRSRKRAKTSAASPSRRRNR